MVDLQFVYIWWFWYWNFMNNRKQLFALVATIILTTYQLVRIIAFVSVYGGVEHDGGWMLSISRSLAEQGTYTTMVSTIVDPSVVLQTQIRDKAIVVAVSAKDIRSAHGRA